MDLNDLKEYYQKSSDKIKDINKTTLEDKDYLNIELLISIQNNLEKLRHK